MKKRLLFRTFQWKNYCSILLLFFIVVLQKPLHAQQFANVTVSWIGGSDNHDCNCGDANVQISECGADWTNPKGTQPDARWRLAAKMSSDGAYPADIIHKKNDDACGFTGWNDALISRTNLCAPTINIQAQSWEEDGLTCGNDNTFDGSCVINAEEDDVYSGLQTFNINYQAYPQNTNNDINITMSNGYTIRMRVNWSAAAGPGAPGVDKTAASVCGVGATSLITVTTAPLAGGVFRWYTDAALTNLVHTGQSYNAGVGTYYVTQWNGTCNSAATIVTVSQAAAIAAPAVANNGPICTNSLVTLSSSTLLGANQQIRWSTDNAHANVIGSGSPFTYTTPLTANTPFYGWIYNTALDCWSPSSQTDVVVSAAPASPVVTSPVSTCLNGQPVLTATTGGANGTFNWYSVPTGGTAIWNGASYQTPPVNGTVTFYVAEVDPTTGCESARSAVVVNSDLNLTAPTATASPAAVCSGGSTTITANGAGGVFYWYADAALTDLLFIGNPYIPQNINSNTTYYVVEKQGTCTSPSAQVAVTVTPTQASPQITFALACPGQQPTVTIADLGGGETYTISTDPDFVDNIWPNVTAGSHLLDIQTQPKTYYIRTNGACPSATSVIFVGVLNANSSEPVATAANACVGSNATISVATTTNGTVTLLNSSRTVIGTVAVTTAPTTATFNVPTAQIPTAGTYTFLVTQAGSACLSDTVPVTVVVNDVPAAPTAAAVTVCAGQSANLEAEGLSGATFTWYNSAALNNAVQVGSQYNTPALSTNTSYWVTQSLGGCTSTATSVQITIDTTSAPYFVQGYTMCEGQTVPANEGLLVACIDTSSSTYVPPTISTLSIVGTGTPAAIGPNSGIVNSVSFDASAIPAGATITKVTLTTSMYHTWWEDVVMDLVSPTATTVSVLNNPNIGGGDNFGTGGTAPLTYTFDDAAASVVVANPTGTDIPAGTYKPVGVFATFNGNNPVGIWTLNVSDDTNIDGGSLTSATLNITYSYGGTPPPPVTTSVVTTATNSSLPVSIGPNSGLSATLTFDNSSLPANATITNVELLTTMRHSWMSDVELILTSPTSTTNQVISANGNGDDLGGSGNTVAFNYLFTDSAAALLAAHPTLSYIPAGNFRPNQAFSVYNGQAPNGIWTLKISDLAGGDGGQMTAASLRITYTVPVPETSALSWWDAPVGGTLIGTGSPFMPSGYETLAPGTYTYYASCDSISNSACGRKEVTLTILPAITAPVVTGDTLVCTGGSTVLTVSNAASQVEWYTDAALTILAHTGSVYSIPNVATATTLYVVNYNGICRSEPTQVNITLLPKPQMPEPSEDFYVACWDDFTTLTASNDAGDEIHWYLDKSGLDQLAVGEQVTTPELASWTRFYFDAVDPVTGCHSDMNFVDVYTTPKFEAPRVDDIDACITDEEITLTAHVSYPRDLATDFYDYLTFYYAEVRFLDNTGTVGLPLSLIGTASVPLDPFNDIWEGVAQLTIPLVGANYDYSAPGTYDIGARTSNVWLNPNTEELFECSSDYGTASLVINDQSISPVVANDTICEGQTATLVATGESEIKWYADAALTNLLFIGSIYTTQPLLSQTTYYVVSDNGNGCPSDPTEVTVTVNPAVALPFGTQGYTICLGQTVQPGNGLQAYCSGDSSTIISGGNGNTVTANVSGSFDFPMIIGPSQSVSGDITFNVSGIPAGATVTSVTLNTNIAHTWVADVYLNLTSPTSVSVDVTNPVWEGSLSSNFGSSNGTVAQSYTFADAATNSLTSGLGSSYDFPSGSYLPFSPLAVLNSGDPNGTWTLHVEDIWTIDAGFINNAILNITYTESNSTDTTTTVSTLTWWDSPTGGIQVGTGSPFLPSGYDTLTPGNYTFWAQCDSSACDNNRTPVVLTILPQVVAPIVTNPSPLCSGSTATLTVTNPVGQVEWYADSNLTILLGVGITYTTQPLNTSMTYYVVNNNGSCLSPATVVTVTLHPITETPVADADFFVTCFDDFTVLYASNSNDDEIHWYLDKGGLDEVTGAFGFDANGEFTTPELASWTRFYFDAVDPVTGCHSQMNYVDVYTTPKFEAPRLDDVTVCQSEDSITLTAHVTYPRDLAVDFFDNQTFWFAGVRFLDNTGTTGTPLSVLGTVLAPLDPFNDIWEGVASLTIPVVDSAGNWDYSVPGIYDIGARTINVWFTNTNLDDIIACSSDYSTASLTIVETPVAPTANTDTICEGSTTTLVASGVNGAVFTWYDSNNLDHAIQVGAQYNTPVLTTTTTYYITQTVGGCEGPALAVTVVVTPQPAMPVINSNTPVCEGDNLILTSTVVSGTGVQYNWYDINGTLLGTTSVPQFVISGVTTAQSGVYSVTASIGNCVSAASTTTVVVKSRPANPVISIDTATVCERGDVTVCATSSINDAVFVWTGPNGFASNSNCLALSDVTTANSGWYYVSIATTECNSGSDSVYINVNAAPTADSITTNAPICEHETLLVNVYVPAGSSYSYSWSGPNGFTSTAQNITIANATEVQHQGFYTVTITNTLTGCTSKPISKYVEINAFPDKLIASNRGPVCEGNPVTIEASKVFGATYFWQGPNATDTITTFYPNHTVIINPSVPSQSGVWTVYVTLAGGCVDSAKTDVVIRTNPVAHAGVDTVITQGTILQLNGTTDNGPLPVYPGITFNWSPSELLNYNNVPNPLADFTELPSDTPVVFIFKTWDKFGCSDEDTVIVHVIPSTQLIIPDLITPNGDGLNDTWQIAHIDNLNAKGIPYTVQIFARGGALLYSTNNYNNANGFDGTYKGNVLPDGAYWFVITTPDKTFKGALHIKR